MFIFKTKILKIRRLLLLLVTLIPTISNQQMLSPQMLEQLKSLPMEQQELIGQQYGIDIELLRENSTNTNNPISSSQNIGKNAEIINRNDFIDRNKLNKIEQVINEVSRIRRDKPVMERSYEELMRLPIYGSFLFEDDTSTFAPVDSLPVPDGYRLGAGDTLSIFLYGNDNITIELPISRVGDVNFPRLGSISIGGMTFSEAKSLIENRVSTQLIGTTAEVSMGDLKSINVLMVGEVKIPGLYSVSSLASVMQMLFISGGVNEIGSLRDIDIKRDGKIINKFDAYEILLNGNSSQDIRMRNGDTILVNILKNTVVVDGEIRRPGKYEFIEGNTIDDLINLAGGLTNKASVTRVTLERFNQENQQPDMINIDLTKGTDKKINLMDGDILRINPLSNRQNNRIFLRGAFVNNGAYGWKEGMRFSDVLDDIEVDLEENADLNRALILRKISYSSPKIKVLGFNPIEATHSPQSDYDPVLEDLDEIIILDVPTDLNILIQSEIEETSSSPPSSDETQNEIDTNEIENLSSDENLDNNSLADDNPITFAQSLGEENPTKYQILNQRTNIIKKIVMKLKSQSDYDYPAQIISITGAVKNPGEYPFIAGDTVRDLIKLAGGLNVDAFLEKAEIRRIDNNQSFQPDIRFLSVNLNEEFISNRMKLKNRDHLRVNSKKDWSASNSIQITGEVLYPGEYIIKPGEKLSSVLNRAGGITSEGFAEAAIFTRESVKDKEQEQLNIIANDIRREIASKTMTKENSNQSVNSEQTESVINAILDIETTGRLVIDLPKVIAGDEISNISVMDGDVLTIPKYNNIVTIVGQVRRPGSFTRQNNFKISDYIELAAGLTERADKSRIYIIKPNGSIIQNASAKMKLLEFNSIEEVVNSGDTIVIPIKSNYETPLNYYSTITQAIFQSLTSIFAIDSLLNGSN